MSMEFSGAFRCTGRYSIDIARSARTQAISSLLTTLTPSSCGTTRARLSPDAKAQREGPASYRELVEFDRLPSSEPFADKETQRTASQCSKNSAASPAARSTTFVLMPFVLDGINSSLVHAGTVCDEEIPPVVANLWGLVVGFRCPERRTSGCIS